MRRNKNWFVRCKQCKGEIEYGYPLILDKSNNPFCDEQCLCLYHNIRVIHLDDNIGIEDSLWEKFDDDL